MINVSFRDTGWQWKYSIFSYDTSGALFCVAESVQLNSTPTVFAVAKQGFVISTAAGVLGGGGTHGLRFSGMRTVNLSSRSSESWGFIITGDNPSLEVYDNS